MPEKVVYIGGVGRVSFPDTMGDEDIARTIQEKIIPQSRQEQAQGSSTFGSTFVKQLGENVNAGLTKVNAPARDALSLLQEGANMLGIGRGPQATQNFKPVTGAANVATGAAGLAASPFTAATEAVRQIPVVGPHIAGATELPFKAVPAAAGAIQSGLDKVGVSKNVQNFGLDPETAQALARLAETGSMFGVAGGMTKAVPKIGPKPLPDMSRAKSTGAQVDQAQVPKVEVTDMGPLEIPQAFRTKMVKELGAETMTPMGAVGKLSDADLARVYKDAGLDVPAPLSEAPVSRGGDLSVRGPANEAQIAKAEVPVDPVQKVINAITQANPVREQQERLYHLERIRRAGKLEGVYGKERGEESFGKALSTQKGPLPKAQFEPIRDKITQADIDAMHNKVVDSDLQVFEKLTAQKALDNLFTKEGTGVPTKGELSLLEDVFGAEFAKSILDKRENWQKIKDELVDAANVPRTVMSAFDMSMPLRQAVIQVASHPIKTAPAWKEMHKSFFSEKSFQEIKKNLKERPNAPLYREFKLDILDPDKQSGPLTAREESFTSHIAERIPLIGRGVRMSERAAYTFTNKVRADIFDMRVEELKKQGITPEKDPNHYVQLAKWINLSTGRGSFGSFTRYAPTMSAVLFSPRLLASRFQALNPLTYRSMPKEVKRMAQKDMIKFVGTTTALLSLAKAGGANVELDPRASDFGKIKIGNTRIDPWGGFIQIARLVAQVTSGQRKTQAGNIVDMDNKTPYSGNRLETLSRFGESKLNPHIGFITSWLKGKNFAGEPFELDDEAVQRLVPLYLQDAYDAMEDDGLLKGFAKSAPGFYGMGSSTYKPKIGKSKMPSPKEPPTPKVP